MSEKRVIDPIASVEAIPRLKDFILKMSEKKLDYIIVYFNGLHTFLEPNIVFLLSGFKPIGESALVVNTNGNTTLITSPAWDAERAKKTSKTKNVIVSNDIVETLKAELATKKAAPEKIGFIGIENMNPKSYFKISEVFAGELNIVTDEFNKIADSKSEEEIENARKATWIAERGFEKVLEFARPGIFDYQLAGELVSFMKSLGADDNFLLMSASQHNQAVRPPGRRRIEKGDIILAEISPSYKGQFSQICRSVVLGCDNKELLEEKYNLLVYAMNEGIKAAKPGSKMSDIVKAINTPIEEAGYAKYCVPPYMRVRGHGLGLGSLLPGDVGLHNDIILKEGMFFVIHPNQYIPETGYLLCGEPVLITADGAEPLTSKIASLATIQV